jgi:hypothetical protein
MTVYARHVYYEITMNIVVENISLMGRGEWVLVTYLNE